MALKNTPLSTLVTRHNKSVQERFDDAKGAVAAHLDGLADDPHLSDREKIAHAELGAFFFELLADPAKRAAALAITESDVVELLHRIGAGELVLDEGSVIPVIDGRPQVRGAGRHQQNQGQQPAVGRQQAQPQGNQGQPAAPVNQPTPAPAATPVVTTTTPATPAAQQPAPVGGGTQQQVPAQPAPTAQPQPPVRGWTGRPKRQRGGNNTL